MKAAGRAQFAQLLRVLSIPSVLVGKELLATADSSSNIKKFNRPSVSSTLIVTRGIESVKEKERSKKRKNRKREKREIVHCFYLLTFAALL